MLPRSQLTRSEMTETAGLQMPRGSEPETKQEVDPLLVCAIKKRVCVHERERELNLST